MFKKKLYIQVLENGVGLEQIDYAKKGDAGMDLRAAIPEGDRLVIPAHGWEVVPCGFKMQLPKGYEGQVRPRSGLAAKHGITVLNSPGTIDEGYRGEVGVILINHSQFDYTITRGDRIAQLVIAKYANVSVVPKENLSVTIRGEGGFGSSGKK